MNTKSLLKQLAFGQPRGVGNTTLLVEATKSQNGVLVCATSGHAQELKTLNGIATTSLDSLPQSVAGTKKPVVYDNYALSVIAMGALKDIENLEAENRKLEETLDKIGKLLKR